MQAQPLELLAQRLTRYHPYPGVASAVHAGPWGVLLQVHGVVQRGTGAVRPVDRPIRDDRQVPGSGGKEGLWGQVSGPTPPVSGYGGG